MFLSANQNEQSERWGTHTHIDVHKKSGNQQKSTGLGAGYFLYGD